MPATLAYGRSMEALRRELREWLSEGEFRDTVGARVTDRDTDRPHAPYAVYLDARTTSAVVVANYDFERAITVDVQFDDEGRRRTYRTVDDPVWRDASAGVTLPPRSAAVVLEQRAAETHDGGAGTATTLARSAR